MNSVKKDTSQRETYFTLGKIKKNDFSFLFVMPLCGMMEG